jgi:hypothetical protein
MNVRASTPHTTCLSTVLGIRNGLSETVSNMYDRGKLYQSYTMTRLSGVVPLWEFYFILCARNLDPTLSVKQEPAL